MLSDWTMKRIAWSLRKVLLPVNTNGLVLDVGSGGNPHYAADVLLDRYIDPAHRFGAALVADRPIVLGDACRMPFKDKAFDFVMAFHVLEHITDPASFLKELERVGRAGYIETPNGIFERLVPYDVHFLEVMESDGMLIINRKKSARPDEFLNSLDLVSTSKRWRKFFYNNPELFHVRYFWKDNIRFKVINPQVPPDWLKEPLENAPAPAHSAAGKRTLRQTGLSLLRRWHKFKKRKKALDLLEILACPECRKPLTARQYTLLCNRCEMEFPAKPFPDFNGPLNR